MIEMTICGRGGQGGVTLAKLIATAYFLRGKYVQAFGVYAAERSGAPLQAYVRVDDAEITNHNQVRAPHHVIVLDRTLIAPPITAGMQPDGWLVFNTPESPAFFAELFPGRRVATVDATGIALANGLGTRTVPIVNTTMLGATAKVLGLTLADVEHALKETKFGGANVTSVRAAFEQVQTQTLAGRPTAPAAAKRPDHIASLLDEDVGGRPALQTGSWANRRPHRHELTPPCNHRCPAGNDVQAFVQAVGAKDFDEALHILLETSPLPGICGRVCPAPCMENCNRAQFDEGVNIREIERYVADHAVWPRVTRPSRDERIAVVGSGPAGLSAAYHLAKLGYPVTLFEQQRELGGVMRTGIPAYRLPRDVLDREISFILRHGVEAQPETIVRRQDVLDLTHRYAAVFLATGLQGAQSLNLGQMGAELATQGIEFLDRARRGEVYLGGKRIVVIGGGNTAMDAARSAKRLGAASVHVLYRRTRTEMPAIGEEIEEALEEGIVLEELVAPLRLHRDGVGPVLTCQRMKLGEPDESGRARPIPVDTEDGQYEVRCDQVILALGQSRDLTILPEGSEIRDHEVLLGLTGAPVLAGGDFATNEGTVAAAIGNGRRAALHIHRTLTGEDLFPPAPAPLAGPQAITMHVFSHAPREHGLVVPPALRRGSFHEVRLGLIDEPGHAAAVLEAQRCFSCGVCNECDRCFVHCPEGIVRHESDGSYSFDYDYCKGCGICASQCPRGVVYMAEL